MVCRGKGEKHGRADLISAREFSSKIGRGGGGAWSMPGDSSWGLIEAVLLRHNPGLTLEKRLRLLGGVYHVKDVYALF